MLIYHQCGHNFAWNVDSLQNDQSGEGLIISPVNVEATRIATRIPAELLARSWFDPQFYLPHDNKSKLVTYPFFPGNVLAEFTTTDFVEHAHQVASQCLTFQSELGLRYHVIPTRYFDDLPEGYLEQMDSLFMEPFVEAAASVHPAVPLLLTLVAKPMHLEEGPARDELLSWATSFQEVSGVYLLFDNSFYSKQIKDPAYLAGQLRFIRALRSNGLEVHVGYSGLEGLLLSLADPTSVSVGAYENLRSFGIQRLETREKTARQSPRPRIYSGLLLQWIDENYLPAMRELVSDWEDLFDDSPYKDFLLDPASPLNFQRAEIYKHYFHVFSRQSAALPSPASRPAHIRDQILQAHSSLQDPLAPARQLGL